MGNSTRSLRSVLDLTMTMPGLDVAFAMAGHSQQPALGIANRVMKDMLSPKFNWKFNRIIVPVFFTISWQQDYASVNVKNVGWIEHSFLRDINNTAFPKPITPLRAVRDLERTSFQLGNPEEVCWLPNDQGTYGKWGGGSQGDPGALSVYTNPLGAAVTPANPFIQIVDTNGNIQVIKTYGITGAVQPVWPAANSAAGVTTNDGTVVWQVADPKATTFRVSPLPPQTGRVWEVNIIAQAKAPAFATMSQLLDPLPDDYASYFEQGFAAIAHEHSPLPDVRAKAANKVQEWMSALKQAIGQGDREEDSAGIYPATNIMDSTIPIDLGPAYPFRR